MTETQLLLLKIVYVVNVFGAGAVGVLTLFAPALAVKRVFEGKSQQTPSLRILGSMWLAISLLSLIGVFKPEQMVVVLLVQLIYKGSWLLVVALPAVMAKKKDDLPMGSVWIFAVYVLVLPFVIPWSLWWNSAP